MRDKKSSLLSLSVDAPFFPACAGFTRGARHRAQHICKACSGRARIHRERAGNQREEKEEEEEDDDEEEEEKKKKKKKKKKLGEKTTKKNLESGNKDASCYFTPPSPSVETFSLS